MAKKIVNLQVICLPVSDPVPAGYEKYVKPGRPNTRLSNKKFEYYVKVQDDEMVSTTNTAHGEMDQNAHDSQLDSLAGFLVSHMKFTDSVAAAT